MDAVQFVRSQHKKIRGLVQQAEASRLRAPEMHGQVIGQLLAEVTLTQELKIRHFYPALTTPRQSGDRVLALARALRTMSRNNVSFQPLFVELQEALEALISGEEAEVLARAERELGPESRAIGLSMEKAHDEQMDSPQYRDAKPEIVQDPIGGEQKRRRGKAA